MSTSSRTWQNKRDSLWRQDNMRCHYCHLATVETERTVDHIVPKSFGGSGLIWNLVASCKTCNEEWADAVRKCDCNRCRHAIQRHHARKAKVGDVVWTRRHVGSEDYVVAGLLSRIEACKTAIDALPDPGSHDAAALRGKGRRPSGSPGTDRNPTEGRRTHNRAHPMTATKPWSGDGELRAAIAPDDPRHGTTRGFYAGCRDMCCRRAICRYEKQGKYARLHGGRAVPAIGSQRRIQALAALGWSFTEIAHAADWRHRNHVRRVLVGQKGKPCTWLEKKTAATISDVFERLCMTIPQSPTSNRTRMWAERQGWFPPLAWDDIDDPGERPATGWSPRSKAPDEAVILRVLAGENVPANRTEKLLITERWVESGRSLNDLERLTGWNAMRYVGEAS